MFPGEVEVQACGLKGGRHCSRRFERRGPTKPNQSERDIESVGEEKLCLLFTVILGPYIIVGFLLVGLLVKSFL